MSKYNKTHACAKVLHSLLCPLSSSSAFFQGLPRLHFAHFTPFQCRVYLSMAEKGKSREEISGGQGMVLQSRPSRSNFPHIPTVFSNSL